MLGTDSHPGFATGLCEGTDASDIGLTFGHGDDAAGIEQIEKVARLEAIIVGRQGQALLQQVIALPLGILEVAQEALGVRLFEVEGRKLALGLKEDVTVALPALLGGDT